MPLLRRLLPASRKGQAILAVVFVLLLVAAWQLLRAWWLRGYSFGARSGILRKISYTGSPLCKYWHGELMVSNPAVVAGPAEVWDFSVHAAATGDPIIAQLKQAEASGGRVTLEYRRDKGRWWGCTDLEYFVTAVSGAPALSTPTVNPPGLPIGPAGQPSPPPKPAAK